jgi:hypothetical protein
MYIIMTGHHDIWVDIDGQVVTGLSVQDIRPLVIGPAGTPIHLRIRRGKKKKKYVCVCVCVCVFVCVCVCARAHGSAVLCVSYVYVCPRGNFTVGSW